MGRPVVHFEIGCRDSEKTSAFFAEPFDWTINADGPAAMIDTGSKDGIMGHISVLGHEPHNYVNVYIEVDDLEAYLKKAESLGGKTAIPPVEIPGQGSFAWFTDPEGTIIGLWKSLS